MMPYYFIKEYRALTYGSKTTLCIIFSELATHYTSLKDAIGMVVVG